MRKYWASGASYGNPHHKEHKNLWDICSSPQKSKSNSILSLSLSLFFIYFFFKQANKNTNKSATLHGENGEKAKCKAKFGKTNGEQVFSSGEQAGPSTCEHNVTLSLGWSRYATTMGVVSLLNLY